MSGRRTQAYRPMFSQPLCQLELFDSGEKPLRREPLTKQISTRLYCYANSFFGLLNSLGLFRHICIDTLYLSV